MKQVVSVTTFRNKCPYIAVGYDNFEGMHNILPIKIIFTRKLLDYLVQSGFGICKISRMPAHPKTGEKCVLIKPVQGQISLAPVSGNEVLYQLTGKPASLADSAEELVMAEVDRETLIGYMNYLTDLIRFTARESTNQMTL